MQRFGIRVRVSSAPPSYAGMAKRMTRLPQEQLSRSGRSGFKSRYRHQIYGDVAEPGLRHRSAKAADRKVPSVQIGSSPPVREREPERIGRRLETAWLREEWPSSGLRSATVALGMWKAHLVRSETV